MTKKLYVPSDNGSTLKQPKLVILDPERVENLKDLAAVLQFMLGVLPEHAIPDAIKVLFKEYESNPPPEG